MRLSFILYCMNFTAIARYTLEGGLGVGTITGGAYAAEYSKELVENKRELERKGWELKDKERNREAAVNENTETNRYFDSMIKFTYSLNKYLQNYHVNELNNIKKEDSDTKTLLTYVQEFNNCIERYLKKQQAYWNNCENKHKKIHDLILHKDPSFKFELSWT